ncbi:MAG: DUF3995 domain-containing protein [Actinomycetota bacterium]|nr:DUF3995 domain-containing protein [Actinomycetota bacterium]
MRGFVRIATATTLAGIGVLHAAWGRGSTFPLTSREQLNNTVIGRDATPSPAACYGVAGLLAAASSLVAGLPTPDGRLRRAGVCTVAAALGARAALGFAGRTDLVSPGSVSARFRRMDSRVYSPLCLALAVGAARSL